MGLLVNIVFKVLLLVFTYLKHSEKIFSHGSCPPELEARKNLLVHEWEHLKRSTETHICSQVNKRADSAVLHHDLGFSSCFALDVIDMVSHRPEPSRQPYLSLDY